MTEAIIEQLLRTLASSRIAPAATQRVTQAPRHDRIPEEVGWRKRNSASRSVPGNGQNRKSGSRKPSGARRRSTSGRPSRIRAPKTPISPASSLVRSRRRGATTSSSNYFSVQPCNSAPQRPITNRMATTWVFERYGDCLRVQRQDVFGELRLVVWGPGFPDRIQVFDDE